jgi:hypothetical protein
MYRVGNIPIDAPSWIAAEFRRIEQTWSQTAPFLMLDTLYIAPTKMPEGMIVKADGTTWNPGSGAGVYCRRGGAWTFLG